MGRPRGGKVKKSIESAKNEDAGSGAEEMIPAYKRRARPQKLLKDAELDEEEDIAKVEDEGDGTKKVVPGEDSKGSVENGGKKRRRQSKRSVDPVMEEKDELARPNGFRLNGSRRKSTPRRAAEAGVESKSSTQESMVIDFSS